jgi:hypothetical protein
MSKQYSNFAASHMTEWQLSRHAPLAVLQHLGLQHQQGKRELQQWLQGATMTWAACASRVPCHRQLQVYCSLACHAVLAGAVISS